MLYYRRMPREWIRTTFQQTRKWDRRCMAEVRLSSLFDVPHGDLQPMVQRVLGCVDRVHSVMNLPRVPIIYTDEAAFGRYVPETEDRSRCFELSRRGPYPRLTLAHE